MPSERFHQLKPVKKKNFLKKAYEEFSLHAYEGASITNLVAELKMAKGSVYQYFDNKEDLYLFLISHARMQIQLVLEQACPLPKKEGDFSMWYQSFLVIQLKFFLSLPSYGLLLLRNKTDRLGIVSLKADDPQPTYLMRAATRAGEKLSGQNIYQLTSLPLMVFEFLLKDQPIEFEELITKNKKVEISSEKLLNLCDAFLK